jgi:hypothetical protein
MKLKYKKIILLTTMSTMGIGILTLSVSQDGPKSQGSSIQTILNAEIAEDKVAAEDNNTLMASSDSTAARIAEATTPTPIPTPTPVPDYPVEEKGTYPEIDKLFETYYTAKNNRDIKTLKSIISDPTKVESEAELQARTEYIEDYKKIETYTKKGLKEGTYVVYVYHEIKFTSINTAAPALSKFYVITGEDNKLKIYSGEMEAEEKVYYDACSEDEAFVALAESTDKKSAKAKKKDEDLASFWKSIEKMAKASEKAQEKKDEETKSTSEDEIQSQ